MLKKINNRYINILFCIIIIACDQFTKYFIEFNYDSLMRRDIIIFTLDYVKNYGAAFSLFNGSRIFLSLVSISISILLIYIIIYKKNISNLDLFGYSFILGGTIGNGYDRIIKGYVIDFINLNIIKFPVFNIADISINIGFLLILYGLLKYKR
tara:strand:+ start:443 stop:901 length:459 start_codon:yes stop_codon:yes gene_type:complete